jgi:hypothetical protein
MDKAKRGEMPIRIYKPSRWIQFFAALLTVFAILLLYLVNLSYCSIPIIIWYSYVIWALLIISTQEQLAIYKTGLEYRLGNNRIFSCWEDLQRFEIRDKGRSQRIGVSSTKLEKRQEGNRLDKLLLSNRYTDFIPFHLIDVPAYYVNPQKFEKILLGYVPVANDSQPLVDIAKFAETDFGRELLHYAPQLFEASEEKQKNG